MNARVINDVEFTTKIEQGNTLVLDFNVFGRLVGDLRYLGYLNKLWHCRLLC
jgi:hypothetical protein